MGAENLEPKKIRQYITHEELQQNVVDWSRKTLERRIQFEGFPAIRDGNSWLIPVAEMKIWFKKRTK